MAKMSLTTKDVSIDIDELVEKTSNHGGSKVIETSIYGNDEVSIRIYLIEKHFIRNNSRSSCTLVFIKTPNKIDVEVLSAGAGNGIVFSFSWGADESYVESVAACLIDGGFEVFE